MEKVLEQAKKEFFRSEKTNLSCRWCGSPALANPVNVKEYLFVECTTCGFTFCPYISQSFMEKLYTQGYHAKGSNVPKKGWTAMNTLEPALAIYPPESQLQILDFGCGQSIIPEQLREMGHKVTAVDMAKPTRPHPDRLTGNILELNLPENSFDLAYSFQVFEHLPEPRPVFTELLRLTKPGGHLYIHTDMEPPERENGLENWWYVLPPDHCCFYKVHSFRHILSGTPHQLVREDPKYVIIQKGN